MFRITIIVCVLWVFVLPQRIYAFNQDTSFTLTALVDMDAVQTQYQENLIVAEAGYDVLALVAMGTYDVSFTSIGASYEMAAYFPHLTGNHLWSLSYDALTKSVVFGIDGVFYDPYWTNGIMPSSFQFNELISSSAVVAGSVEVSNSVLSSSQLEDKFLSFFTTPLSRVYSSSSDVISGVSNYITPVLAVGSLIGLLFASFTAVKRFL